MDTAAILQKRDELLTQEATLPETWWWLSFADPELPEGTQFLGVSLVKASGFVTATMYATILDLNPGGEIQGYPIPDTLPVPRYYQNRLLTRTEAEMLDSVWAAELTLTAQAGDPQPAGPQ